MRQDLVTNDAPRDMDSATDNCSAIHSVQPDSLKPRKYSELEIVRFSDGVLIFEPRFDANSNEESNNELDASDARFIFRPNMKIENKIE